VYCTDIDPQQEHTYCTDLMQEDRYALLLSTGPITMKPAVATVDIESPGGRKNLVSSSVTQPNVQVSRGGAERVAEVGCPVDD
jgi:hypothetical protein